MGFFIVFVDGDGIFTLFFNFCEGVGGFGVVVGDINGVFVCERGGAKAEGCSEGAGGKP